MLWTMFCRVSVEGLCIYLCRRIVTHLRVRSYNNSWYSSYTSYLPAWSEIKTKLRQRNGKMEKFGFLLIYRLTLDVLNLTLGLQTSNLFILGNKFSNISDAFFWYSYSFCRNFFISSFTSLEKQQICKP